MKIELPPTVTLPVDQVKPYWRNPRRITSEAVRKVAASIRDYGYRQPIVVDTDHVIIVGHTRFQAIQELGWTEVPVLVTDLPEQKAKEFRLVDNRTNELSQWDHDALVVELREFERGIVEDFFPNVDLEIGKLDVRSEVSDSDIRNATERVTRVTEADPKATHTTAVVCPSCFHSFPVRTRSLPGLTYEDLETLTGVVPTGR